MTSNRLRVVLSLAIVLAAMMAISSCGGSGPADVQLQKGLEDIPSVHQGDTSDEDTLKIAVSGVISPGETLKTYRELLTYIGHEMGREVALIQRPTYAEVNDLVKASTVDLAFICSLAYVQGNRDFGMDLLLAPQIAGQTVYYSYLIVPENSDAQDLEDLRGINFAFTDPLSNSGRLAPTYQLHLMGDTPDSFFTSHVFTYSHDNSIRAVAEGLVDGAAVDSLVYDQMVASDPELASKTKVIAAWGPFGIPPVVVNPELDTELKGQLQDIFLNLDVSVEGRRILNNLEIDRFVRVDDHIYDSIRQMVTQLGW